MKINIFKVVITVFLFFIPYQGLMEFAVLPTWRIINVGFVLTAIFYVRLAPVFHNIKYFFLFSSIFCFYLFFQLSYNTFFYKIEIYDVIYVISVIFLLLFAIYWFILLNKDFIPYINILKYSIVFNTVYQIFQIIVWNSGHRELITLLNGEWVHTMGTFARQVNNIYGPSGLMLEAGHITLFAGPFLLFLILGNYYGLVKTSVWFYLIVALSFVLTISGGAFIEGVFIFVTLALLYSRKIFTVKFNIGIVCTLSFLAIIFYFYEGIDDFIIRKIDSVFSGKSERMSGVPYLLDTFYNNPWLGLAPKAVRYLPGVDPNVFIPSLLADHGLLGTFAFFMLYFLPILFAFIISKHKLFIIPFIAMTLHLFLAYGNYTWTFLWLNYMLILFGLLYSYRKTA